MKKPEKHGIALCYIIVRESARMAFKRSFDVDKDTPREIADGYRKHSIL